MIEPKKQSLPLDVLKGLTIFFVVVSHSFYFGFENQAFSLWRPFLLSIDMPIFMLLAGYFSGSKICFDRTGITAYWQKKSTQLLLPLILLPSINALIRGISFLEIIRDTNHGGYWFSWVLFILFLLFFFVRWIVSFLPQKRQDTLEIILAVTSILLIFKVNILWRGLDIESYTAFTMERVNQLYPCFVIGYFLRKYKSFADFFKNEVIWGALMLVFFFVMYIIYHSNNTWAVNLAMLTGMQMKFIVELPLNILGMLTAFGMVHSMVRSNDSWTSQSLAYLGRESRAIYFVHFFFLFSVPQVADILRETSKRVSSIFSMEVVFSLIYGVVVTLLSLVLIKIIRHNSFLELICFGKRNNPKQHYTLGTDETLSDSSIKS